MPVGCDILAVRHSIFSCVAAKIKAMVFEAY